MKAGLAELHVALHQGQAHLEANGYVQCGAEIFSSQRAVRTIMLLLLAPRVLGSVRQPLLPQLGGSQATCFPHMSAVKGCIKYCLRSDGL